MNKLNMKNIMVYSELELSPSRIEVRSDLNGSGVNITGFWVPFPCNSWFSYVNVNCKEG
jgi:hypothetical protein